MTHSLWEPEAAAEPQVEEPPQQGRMWMPEPRQQAEHASEVSVEQVVDQGTVALSAEDFSALEERILRAVNLVKLERLARAAAEERLAVIESKLGEQAQLAEQMQKELDALRSERDKVRQRVERLLRQLDALEI